MGQAISKVGKTIQMHKTVKKREEKNVVVRTELGTPKSSLKILSDIESHIQGLSESYAKHQ